MTLQECYVKIGGDYNDILHRFMNENMVRKFVLKFPQDNNMALFEESWAKKEETASPQSLPVMFFYNFFFSISGFDA